MRALALLSLVAATACFSPAEGMPPSPTDYRARTAPIQRLPERSPEPASSAASASPSPSGAPAPSPSSFVIPPEPPASEARLLLTHVTRAASQGDRRMVEKLSLPSCLEGSCQKLFALEREILVADEEPSLAKTRAYALVSRVCDDRPCGTMALLFTRDCTLAGTPFRVSEVRTERRGLDRWLEQGAAACPEGPRRAVAPSPFDPSGTPYPPRR